MAQKEQLLTFLKSQIMSLNVSLPAALKNRVREQVSPSMYGSASEVAHDALRFFETYQHVQVASPAALKSHIERGLQGVQNERLSSADTAAVKSQRRTVRSQKAQ